jgi:predicted nucleotidyltransferase
MVTIRQIRAAAREIARQFRPRRITLFGSYARGNPSKDSDVDLLILMEGRQVHDKALQIRRRIDFGFPVDLLVRSPSELRQRIAWGDGFLVEIEKNGKVLYEASDPRVGSKGRGGLSHRTARNSDKKTTQLR